MDENERQRLRNDSLIVLLGAVAFAVTMLDELGQKVSSKKFLELVDDALAARLEKPDGPALSETVKVLRDLLDLRVQRMKSHISIADALNEIMDEIDPDNTFGS